MILYYQMFNIELNQENDMQGYLHPPKEKDLEDEDILYDDYVYEVYRALMGYVKDKD